MQTSRPYISGPVVPTSNQGAPKYYDICENLPQTYLLRHHSRKKRIRNGNMASYYRLMLWLSLESRLSRISFFVQDIPLVLQNGKTTIKLLVSFKHNNILLFVLTCCRQDSFVSGHSYEKFQIRLHVVHVNSIYFKLLRFTTYCEDDLVKKLMWR